MFRIAFYQESFRQFLQKPADCPSACFVHYALDNKRYQYFVSVLLNFHLKFYFGGKKKSFLSLVTSLRGFVSLVLEQMPVSIYIIVFLLYF